MKVCNTFPVGDENIEEMLNNIENYFVGEGDYEPVLTKYGNGHKVDLMYGYDVYTYNDDGTICNSENDKKHFYVEVWDNFEDEAPYHRGDGSPVATWWLEEDGRPRSVILQEALDVMHDVIEGLYDYDKELDMTKERMKELLGSFTEHLIECCSNDEEAVEVLKNSIGLTEEELEELGFGKDYFADYNEDENDEE